MLTGRNCKFKEDLPWNETKKNTRQRKKVEISHKLKVDPDGIALSYSGPPTRYLTL